MTVKQIVNPEVGKDLISSGKWLDFAIQAPEGTEIEVNGSKIIIGSMQIWEMPDNIDINSLKVIKKVSNDPIILIDYVV